VRKAYVVDSRREWPPEDGQIQQFKSIEELLSYANRIQDSDLLLLHRSDVEFVQEKLPVKFGTGNCSVLFYSGGGTLEMRAFEASLFDEDSPSRGLCDHVREKITFYEEEAIPDDPTATLLWINSVHPYLTGSCEDFSVKTCDVMQFSVAVRLLVALFFLKDIDNELYVDLGKDWEDAVYGKDFWLPIYQNQHLLDDFVRENPSWAALIEKIRETREQVNPDWSTLQYGEFKDLIQDII